MRRIKLVLLASVLMAISTPAFASCDMWGTARTNTNIGEFDLKAFAKAAKANGVSTIDTCFGTENLRTEITASPFSMREDPSGVLNIKSSQSGAGSQTEFTTDGQVYKMKTWHDRVEVLGRDKKWHNIDKMKAMNDPLSAMGQGGLLNLEANTQWLKEESDENFAPFAGEMTVIGLGGLVTALAVPYFVQYAPLADTQGVTETVGGYSTKIWTVNNKKAEMYAASRGYPIDTTGSHIRYWVTDSGSVIKIDAVLSGKITQSPVPMTFKYKVAKSAAPDPLWPK